MPKKREIVLNNTPIISLVAATGNLDILETQYDRIIVPYEVREEIFAGGKTQYAVEEFNNAKYLEKRTSPINISSYLASSLDRGEAAVIQVALDEGVELVGIDEIVGRRVARLNGLIVTGSIGILAKKIQLGGPIDLENAIANMEKKGIWLSDTIKQLALTKAAELQKD